MKRVEREDKPSNTSGGSEMRKLEPRLMVNGKMKGENEKKVIEEERGIREITRIVKSIESPRFN